MDKNCTIYIVRHGETDFNVKHITQGHTDSSLTVNGINQAGTLAEVFKDVPFDAAFSSDLSRTKRTAEIVLNSKDIPVNTSELLRERNYGKFDGLPSSMFIQEYRELLQRVRTLHKLEARKVKFDSDIESDEEINNRIHLFLKDIVPQHLGKTILVTTHGGIMRSFLNHLDWNGEEDLKSGAIQNTGYVKVVTDGTNFDFEEFGGIER